MQKVKRVLRAGKNGVQVWHDYGLRSFIKRAVNKQYHKPVDIQTLRCVHLIPEAELERQRQEKFEHKIKFSIITPLYNTPEDFLEELIESVVNQTYDNWELCLADGSDKEHSNVCSICTEWCKRDRRIVYRVLEENRGISENTNECIKLASGDYYGLLDHDDLLHPSALYEVMKAIQVYNADFIYTDEVKFSGDIKDIDDPLAFNLKPGFGKDDLRSHNYICHFTVFSKELLKGEKELYRKECDGSQDHDMVLRLTEKAGKIVHVPKVLYYWRVHSNSVSLNLDTKIYAVDAAIRAIKGQLERQEEWGDVASNLPFQTIYRVRYKIKNNPRVTIILHRLKDPGDMQAAVSKIKENTNYSNIEVICIEPDSTEKTAEKWNRAVKKAEGEYIIFLDAACSPIDKSWLEELLMMSQRKDVCAVAPKIYYKDDTIAFAGLSLDRGEEAKVRFLCSHDTKADIGYEALLCHVRETTSAVAACMMFSREIWERLQGFRQECDGYEDIDFCLRGIQDGKNNVWTCFSEMKYEGRSLIEKKNEVQIKKFEETWNDQFEREQYYHKLWNTLRIV